MLKSSIALRELSLVVVFSALIYGCGGPERNANWPETHPVTGVVTNGGTPIEGATVTFVPKSGTHNAIGTTNAEGAFKLNTFFSASVQEAGAAAGEYVVLVKKPPQLAPEQPSTDGMSQEEAQKVLAEFAASSRKAAQENQGEKSEIPEAYMVRETSPLSATVAEGDNEFTFDVAGG